jgi:hypothetical protein
MESFDRLGRSSKSKSWSVSESKKASNFFKDMLYAVAPPGDAFGVVAENPVAQGLTVRAAELAGFA